MSYSIFPLDDDIYTEILFFFFFFVQLDQRPSTSYMVQVQRDISPSMRGILIDWLVEVLSTSKHLLRVRTSINAISLQVSEEYKLASDTLYLAVNLIDRFLSNNYIEKRRLQLLGVTCMLIAS